jgi:hypothetical protein
MAKVVGAFNPVRLFKAIDEGKSIPLPDGTGSVTTRDQLEKALEEGLFEVPAVAQKYPQIGQGGLLTEAPEPTKTIGEELTAVVESASIASKADVDAVTEKVELLGAQYDQLLKYLGEMGNHVSVIPGHLEQLAKEVSGLKTALKAEKKPAEGRAAATPEPGQTTDPPQS